MSYLNYCIFIEVLRQFTYLEIVGGISIQSIQFILSKAYINGTRGARNINIFTYMYIQTVWMSRAGSFCLLRTNLINLSYEDSELVFFIQSWYSTINSELSSIRLEIIFSC